jgi:hypothetical protein
MIFAPANNAQMLLAFPVAEKSPKMLIASRHPHFARRQHFFWESEKFSVEIV